MKSSFSIMCIKTFVDLFSSNGHNVTQEAAAQRRCSGTWNSLPVLKTQYNIFTLKQWMLDRLRDDRGCYCSVHLSSCHRTTPNDNSRMTRTLLIAVTTLSLEEFAPA